MPSPFPGMNPYLEQSDCWEDFHRDFLVRCRAALTPLVGPNYIVKLEARLLLRERSADERGFIGRADIGVSTDRPSAKPSTTTATLQAPVQLVLPAFDNEEQVYLEIQERRNRRVVTVIELLSPSNKDPGADREAFLQKRNELLSRRVHYLEIDLRRGGQRLEPPAIPPCAYVLLSRAEDRPSVGVWPIGLRDRLPTVPVPLQSPDSDATLDLQAILHATWEEAGYERYVYQGQPDPLLSTTDRTWAESLIQMNVN